MKPPPLQQIPLKSNSIQKSKEIEIINGKIIKDIELTKMQKDGNIVVKGKINKTPIYYKKKIKPKFRNRHVKFNMDNVNSPNKIRRTLTPFEIGFVSYPLNNRKTTKNKIDLIEKINKNIKTRKTRKTRK